MIVTQAVAQLGKCDVDHILSEVRNYNDFTPDNDPFSEHDFGSIQLAENTIVWKIDYYDLDLHKHSPDPSDPAFTARILTIVGGGILKPNTDHVDTNTAKLPSSK